MEVFNSINTHTKVRRLGYFLQLIREIGEDTLAEEAIVARLTSWSEDNYDLLLRHIDSSGVIKGSLKNTSAHRYLTNCVETKLIAKIATAYRLTKYGKILLLLTSQKYHSPFTLTLAEKCFLLNKLLLLDSDYLGPFLQLLQKYGRCDLMLLQEKFRHAVLAWLDIKSKYVFAEEPQKRNEIIQVQKRIKDWRNPEKYSEHVVPPRIHWLLDLRLIDWELYKRTNKFALSKEGKTIFSRLPKVQNHRYITRSWLENDFFEHFIKAFSPKSTITRFSQLEHKKQDELVFRLLKQSFSKFRTTELWRIAASQFLYYTCIKLSVQNKVACGFKVLKERLKTISEDPQKNYYFYWSEEQDDGHITKH